MTKPIEFNPTVADLQLLKENYGELKIKGADDLAGIAMADDGRKELKKARVAITKRGKELRSEAVDWQRAIIKKEKELVAIIEPIEKSLQLQLVMIENEKELPARKKELAEINAKIEDSVLIKMNKREYKNFYEDSKTEYLEEQNRKLQKIEDEKRQKEANLKAKREAREAEKKRGEKKLQAEKEKLFKDLMNSFTTIKQFEKYKEENEFEEQWQFLVWSNTKQSLQNQIDALELKNKELEQAQQKNDKYQKWLKENKFCGEDDMMILRQTETEIRMYQLVSTFKK